MSERPPPEYLYKFRSVSNETDLHRLRSILLEHQLFWPSPASFNDPFDCFPVAVVDGSPEDQEAFVRRVFKREQPNISDDALDRVVEYFFAQPLEERRRNLETATRETADASGVLCLAGNRDSIQMWSHYADSHRGVCLRFRTKSDLQFGLALEVRYSPDRPTINLVNKDRKSLVEKVIQAKALGWEYEDEWRLVGPGKPPGQYPFKPDALDQVILGAQISSENRDQIVEWCRRRAPPVAVLQAEFHPTRFGLLFSELR